MGYIAKRTSNGTSHSVVTTANVTAASFTYDAFARVKTATDSEGWTVTYDYDAADRNYRVSFQGCSPKVAPQSRNPRPPQYPAASPVLRRGSFAP
jgi:hypothetical protein